MDKSLTYYSEVGCVTDLLDFKEIIDSIPDNPEYICQVVQGLIVHGAWCKIYGFEDCIERTFIGANISNLLKQILLLDSRPVTIARLPENRVIASCREFSTLACSIMRSKGVPARSRCGFAVYLGWKGSIEDHWVVEYWNGSKWIMNDPQIDPFQLSQLLKWGLNKISIQPEPKKPNPHNLTDDDFIIAGKAWQMCRTEIISPDICGISDIHGLWFVRGQLLRDFASLNKIETVPYLNRIERNFDWKLWDLLNKSDEELTPEEFDLLDHIADLTLNVDENLTYIRECYAINEPLHVPNLYIE